MSIPSIYTTLCIDRQNGGLISVGNSATQMPSVGQRNQRWYLIKIYDPATNPNGGQPTALTLTQLGTALPRMTIYIKATPDQGDENTWKLAYLYEAGWTWNATLGGYLGQMNFNTVQLQNYMISQADGESVTVECEIDWSDTGVITTLVFGEKNPITIYAQGDEAGNPAISIIGNTPTFSLPIQFKAASGSIYVLDETAPGAGLAFTLLP
jgi:hypothetical protein